MSGILATGASTGSGPYVASKATLDVLAVVTPTRRCPRGSIPADNPPGQ